MVDVYLYLVKRLPRRLPILKDKLSNVYHNVYLFMLFLKWKVYLLHEFGRRRKKLVDFVGRRLPPVGLTSVVDVEKGLFPPVGKPFWVDVGPDFYIGMGYFLIFGGFL